MQHIKKWLCLLLALALAFTLLPRTAVRAADPSDKCGDNLTWSFDEDTGELTVSGYGEMWDFGEFVASPWDSCVEAIKILTIEDGVTSIGEGAFAGCTNLTTVYLPYNLEQIGVEAFFYCTSLSELWLSEGLKSIGGGAFSRCYCLETLYLPRSVTTLGENAFIYCSGLESVELWADVESVGSGAFSECTALTDVTLMNEACQIFDKDVTLGDPVKTTIHGFKGSTAEAYADKYGYSFEELRTVSGYCGHPLDWSLDLVTGELTISGTGEMMDWFAVPPP